MINGFVMMCISWFLIYASYSTFTADDMETWSIAEYLLFKCTQPF